MAFNADEAIAPAIRQEIQTRLDQVETEDGVRLLLAIESGSRAWGFPSPDSDYDIRFIYVRDRDWYLQLRPGRDVIEHPITDDIDLNGWDIRKALGLLLKSNAVISEWIDSPIWYRGDERLVAQLRSLADDVLDARALAHHYARLGGNAAERWLGGADPVAAKRYFYALRPALAIRALRHDPTVRPPMNLQALVAASHLPKGLEADIGALVDAKRQAKELSIGMRMPCLDALILAELNTVSEIPMRSANGDGPLERANEIFLQLVNT